MNSIIKYLAFFWLIFCALFVWVGIAGIGFFLAFTNYSFMYAVTPSIGFTAVVCIMKYAFRVIEVKPFDYIKQKVEGYLG